MVISTLIASFALSGSAFTANFVNISEAVESTFYEAVISENGDIAISPFTDTFHFSNRSLSMENNNSWNSSFDLAQSHKYLKVFYDNLSSISAQVIVTKVGSTNPVIDFTVSANKNDYRIISNATGGKYIVEVKVVGGSVNLDGSISVKSSDSKLT